MDRDPRFVGGWQGDDFPSAFMRYLMALGIHLDICPPRRPDLKPFIERVYRTVQEECLTIEWLDSLADARDALRRYRLRYNNQRPHQGKACGNRPSYVAFPRQPALRRLLQTIDPDDWLRVIHGRQFRRQVQTNGSVQMDNRTYYIGKQFAGQQSV